MKSSTGYPASTPLCDGFLDALLHGLGVFLGNPAADDFPLEDKSRAGFLRLDLEPNVAVLALTARLPDELALFFDGFRNRFFVSNLRLADVRFDFELAPQAVENDLQMQFAHARDDRLLSFLVGTHPEGWVFLRQARQRRSELILISLGLRLDRLRDHWLRKR